MGDPLDLSRLTELRQLGGMTPEAWEETVLGLIESLSRVIERLDGALLRAEPDLTEATQAAHLGRNDALMLGSSQLAGALGAVEQAARGEDAALAIREFPRVKESWPGIRDALERLLSADSDKRR